MDCMFEAYLTHESVNFEPDDIPQTSEPVWILGKKYNATQGIIFNVHIYIKLWILLFIIGDNMFGHDTMKQFQTNNNQNFLKY